MFDVLVAEDHPYNQVLMSEILDSIGCRVSMAENGKDALDQLDAHDFDLIIMDNRMPVMSGIEAIAKIRARTDWKVQIPIITLTANAMRGAEKEHKALGVNEFITKPLDVGQVIDSVKRLAEIGRKIRTAAHSAVI
jgi:CheY-like chemotaxis protein